MLGLGPGHYSFHDPLLVFYRLLTDIHHTQLISLPGLPTNFEPTKIFFSPVEGEKNGGKKEYVAHLTVRVPHGYVTVKLLRHDVGLRAVVGVVGRVPEPDRFGPRAPCWEVLKAFLSAPYITTVSGDTYPIRLLLSEAGYYWDKVARVYRRSLTDAKVVTAVTPQPARR